jgi:hypothetical protein
LGDILSIGYKLGEESEFGTDTDITFFLAPNHPDRHWKTSLKIEMARKELGTNAVSLNPVRLLQSPTCPHCNKGLKCQMDLLLWNIRKRSGFMKNLFSIPVSLRSPPDGFVVDVTVDQAVASNNTGSRESWSQVKHWLARCNSDHINCPKLVSEAEETRWYPTRLLDLQPRSSSQGDDLRLVISKEHLPQGDYMTLSHCWGKLPFMILTTETIDIFRAHIRFSNLTKSFQDAITITRRLGIRYLWIDSLCIIQRGPGSKSDWGRESAMMDRIYENSYLNIGATGASDGRYGCFQERRYEEISRPIFHKPECKLHPQKHRRPYRLIENTFLEDTLLREPLLQRGWVFQERYLSPRMLHFGSKQLFWECKGMQVCESFPTNLHTSSPFPTLEDVTRDDDSSMSSVPAIDIFGHIRWYQIIKEYTSKNLTRAEDKLIAFSGVARLYAARVLDDDTMYLAGIWSIDLPRGLLWYVSEEGRSSRPKNWRAPSWSWASVEGRIENPLSVSGRKLSRIHLVDIQHDSPNAFSTLALGIITVLGRLVPVKWTQREDGGFGLTYNGRDVTMSHWHPDELPPSTKLETLLCLSFFTGSNGLYGLTIVKKEGSKNQYLRTGMFSISPGQASSENWIYPNSPFVELLNADVEEEDVVELV